MTRNTVDYEKDFYAWTVEQARLLRSGELSEIDVENIAEEIESMGRSERREIGNRLTVLLSHLLKWHTSAGHAFVELVGHDPATAPADRKIIARVAEPEAICGRSGCRGVPGRPGGRARGNVNLPEDRISAVSARLPRNRCWREAFSRTPKD